MGTRHGANHALICELVQPIDREDDIPVLLKTGPVEIDRDVADQQLSRLRIGRDYPVIGISAAERLFSAAHETGRGNNRNPAVRQRWPTDPGLRIEAWTLQLRQPRGLCRR